MWLRLDNLLLVLQEGVQICYLTISMLNSFNSIVEFRLLILHLTLNPQYLLIFLFDIIFYFFIFLFDFTL